jgi:hypothetical protein
MSRRTVGLGVLAIWLVGLALLYRRSTFRSPEHAFAEAGMRVSPATYYYRLDQEATQIGSASSAVDTTSTQLIATDFVHAAVRAGRDTFRIQARSQARFTRALSLTDFILKAEGDLSPFLLRGVMQGEGNTRKLQLTTETPKHRPAGVEYDIDGLVFTPTVAAIPLMLRDPSTRSDALPIEIFDPMSRSVRKVNLKVGKDSLFMVTDSAMLDSATGRWVKAHADTVRGWQIAGDAPTITAWVDASGRLIGASEPGGIALTRTAFEIAFENWRLETKAAAQLQHAPTNGSVAATRHANAPVGRTPTSRR